MSSLTLSLYSVVNPGIALSIRDNVSVVDSPGIYGFGCSFHHILYLDSDSGLSDRIGAVVNWVNRVRLGIACGTIGEIGER